MELKLFKLQLIYHNCTSSKTLLIKIFLLSTAMGLLPFLNLLYPSNEFCCNPSFPFQNPNLSDLLVDLADSNWLVQGAKSLAIGRDSLQVVKVMRKLGFPDAVGVHRRFHRLPYKKGSFGFVFSTGVIERIRVPARMVVEMERVLKPGGVGVVVRRVGDFPATSVMKVVAPVGSYLKISDVVGVRSVNCTVVMVVFRKRVV